MTLFYKYRIKNNLKTKYFFFKNNQVFIAKRHQNLGKENKIILTQKPLAFFNKTNLKSISNKKFQVISKNLLKKKSFLFIKNLMIKSRQIYKTILKLNGLGFRTFKFLIIKNDGFFLKFKLGLSHKVYIQVPRELRILCRKKNKITIQGFDKEKVTNFAKKIQYLKMPEIYSGKGIIYTTQSIKIKPGKKKN
uniref:Ribosomal protein L6 n=1 Tax=Cyanophora paradoxa TaxID=2762 RepID=A0A097PBN1_CYAPA|nr:ribosomal protein L6 [Cyanophora paradoxa]